MFDAVWLPGSVPGEPGSTGGHGPTSDAEGFWTQLNAGGFDVSRVTNMTVGGWSPVVQIATELLQGKALYDGQRTIVAASLVQHALANGATADKILLRARAAVAEISSTLKDLSGWNEVSVAARQLEAVAEILRALDAMA
jgi:hypothetical protein